MRMLLAGLVLAGGLFWAAFARSEEPVLTLSLAGEPQRFTAAELLGHVEAATLNVPADVGYGRAMSYKAVPLLALLGIPPDPAPDTIEARAIDGFVAQIPLALVEKGRAGGSVAWIAVEDPAEPWPDLPGKTVSAGPFYLVWEHPERSGVGSELWPFQLGSLAGVESPAHRWPQMAVDAGLPADAPEHRGQAVFATQCLSCHRMKGAGAADIGPDLGAPMSPTEYLTLHGLRLLIRNPKAVRTWPLQQMPGFDEAALPEADLDALIAYLTAMAAPPKD